MHSVWAIFLDAQYTSQEQTKITPGSESPGSKVSQGATGLSRQIQGGVETPQHAVQSALRTPYPPVS